MNEPSHQAAPDTVRRALCAAIAGTPLVGVPAKAQAQASDPAFAQRAVKVLVPAAAGSSIDSLARALGQRLAPLWGQSVVVENVAGAGGVLGSQAILRAPADGHTLGVVAANLAVSPALAKAAPYDLARDFSYLAQVASTPMVLYVHPSVPAHSISELVEHGKKVKELAFASAGNGSTGHLAAELLKQATGLSLSHVPYKSVAQALTDTVGGQVAMFFAAPSVGMEHVKSGRLRAIAHTGSTRVAAAPSLPSFAESGLADVEIEAWFGVIAPAGISPALLTRLNRDLSQVVNSAAFREYLAAQDFQFTPKTSEAFKAMVMRDSLRWKGMAKAGVIQAG